MEKEDEQSRQYSYDDVSDLEEEYIQKFGKGFMVLTPTCDYTALYNLAKDAMKRGYPLSRSEIDSTVSFDFPNEEDEEDVALEMMGLTNE